MCLIRVTKTWFACHAPFNDSHPLNSALIISPKFSSMFMDIYCLLAAKIWVELPNMHPFTMTTRSGARHLLSKWLWRFTDRDTFLQSRYDSFPCLTQFQQTCFHPWSRRLKLPSGLLLPGADEKLPLDQKRWITLKIPLYMAHIVRC